MKKEEKQSGRTLLANFLCKVFDHKRDKAQEHYRTDGERYTFCLRCGKEITYGRYVDSWYTRVELHSSNLRDWCVHRRKI